MLNFIQLSVAAMKGSSREVWVGDGRKQKWAGMHTRILLNTHIRPHTFAHSRIRIHKDINITNTMPTGS